MVVIKMVCCYHDDRQHFLASFCSFGGCSNLIELLLVLVFTAVLELYFSVLHASSVVVAYNNTNIWQWLNDEAIFTSVPG